jgi:hypothetical protein
MPWTLTAHSHSKRRGRWGDVGLRNEAGLDWGPWCSRSDGRKELPVDARHQPLNTID